MLSGAILSGLVAVLALPACSRSLPASRSAAFVRAEPLARQELERAARLDPGTSIDDGWELASDDARFGGFSGILVERDHVHLLSDRGWLWSAERPRSASSPAIPTRWRVRTLHAGGGAPDSEALALDGTARRLVVALEGTHALAYAPSGPALPASIDLATEPLPTPLDALPGNQGVEALARLPDGSLLAIAEGGSGTLHPAVLIEPRRTRRLAYRSAPGFAPTGADRVGGWLVVVERRVSAFSGLSARITATPVDAGDTLPEVIEPPVEIARLSGLQLPDNLEGIAAEWTEAADALRLWLVADDNFSPLQRTLLIRLVWKPQAPERASSRRLSRTSSAGSSASPTDRR